MINTKKVRVTRASATKLGVPGAAAKPLRSQTAGKTPTAEVEETLPQPSKAKPRLVRDSFTIPKSEYAVLDALKLRAANLTRPTKKSELLRAGIAALNAMTDKEFLSALESVPSLKTGRPKAESPAAEVTTSWSP